MGERTTFDQIVLGSSFSGYQAYSGQIAMFRIYAENVGPIEASNMVERGYMQEDKRHLFNFVPCDGSADSCFAFRSNPGSCVAVNATTGRGTCNSCSTKQYTVYLPGAVGQSCVDLTVCAPGEYESVLATRTSDRQCANVPLRSTFQRWSRRQRTASAPLASRARLVR